MCNDSPDVIAAMWTKGCERYKLLAIYRGGQVIPLLAGFLLKD